MKITRETGLARTGPDRETDRLRRADAAGTPTGDTVTISAEARRKVEAVERGPAAMEPGERRRLVAALKDEVGSGRYRPDLKRTAMFLVHDGEETLT